MSNLALEVVLVLEVVGSNAVPVRPPGVVVEVDFDDLVPDEVCRRFVGRRRRRRRFRPDLNGEKRRTRVVRVGQLNLDVLLEINIIGFNQ